MSNRTEVREKFINTLISLGKPTVTKSEIKSVCKSIGISSAQWFTREPSNKVGRGLYAIAGNAVRKEVVETETFENTVKRNYVTEATVAATTRQNDKNMWRQ